MTVVQFMPSRTKLERFMACCFVRRSCGSDQVMRSSETAHLKTGVRAWSQPSADGSNGPRPMARKKTTKKNSAAKKTSAKAKKAPSSRKRKKASVKKTSASLGRPRIAGTAELDLEFKGDFGARQIFQFLDVQTFKELEEFSPQEITDRVITPLVQAVERIRK